MATRESFGKTVELDKYPTINPAIWCYSKKFLPTFSGTYYGVKIWIILLLLIFLGIMIYYMAKLYYSTESPDNIRCKLNNFLDKFEKYGDNRSSRKGILEYIEYLQSQGVPDSALLLTNFYVSASTSPGIFLPIRDGIASPDAIRLTLAAGARYLDFQIWSDGKRNKYRPMIKGMDEDSKWRRITMTEMPFRTAMEIVMKYALSGPQADANTNNAPYCHDPLIIMLRIDSKLKYDTYTEIANILRDTIEPYRLDFTYNKWRNSQAILRSPITTFLNKIIIISNVFPPNGNILSDYINIGPRTALPMDLSSKELKTIPDNNYSDYVRKIGQNITISRNALVEPDCDKNINDWKMAQSFGIQITPMNFWIEDDSLKEYMSNDNFGIYSFKLKPEALIVKHVYIEPPLIPHPSMNARDGKPIAPQAIIIPK
jgi:hypothetical protein